MTELVPITYEENEDSELCYGVFILSLSSNLNSVYFSDLTTRSSEEMAPVKEFSSMEGSTSSIFSNLLFLTVFTKKLPMRF